MLSALSASRIWLCTQPTDMRCSFDGLSARVRRYLGEDPTSGQWFVFINRRRTMLKILGFVPRAPRPNGETLASSSPPALVVHLPRQRRHLMSI